MKMSEEELKRYVLEKGTGDKDENLRVYNKFFKDWRSNHEYIYRRFDISRDSKILDIGCNYGMNLINFAEGSVGIESNPPIVAFARRLGLDIVDMNAEDDLLSLNHKFDLIWCTDFLVHMASPFKFLYECRNLLEENGRILIQIPLMSIFGMHRSPCHFYAFNKKALIYLIESAGYEVMGCSGYIRNKPGWFNAIFEPLLQIWGGNIWVMARKKAKPLSDFNSSFLPKWFKL
jgi:SAM-dependent methyltransferase